MKAEESRDMKVCLLNDSFPPVIDGVANVVQNYASVMTDEKLAEAAVATPEYPGADYDIYPYKVYPYQSFDTTEIVKGYRAGNPLALHTINELGHFSPDIIHSHCPFSSTVMARLLRVDTGAPIVFTYHTKFDADIKRALKAKFLQKEAVNLIIRNVSACDEIWTVSKGAGEDLKELGYEGEYHVVNNGVDFAKGKADEKAVKDATNGFDLPEDIPMFLFVGRLMDYKGLPLIADALKKLSEAGIDYRMVFVGGGADAEKLQQDFMDAGIAVDIADGEEHAITEGHSGMTGRVIFTGPIYDREVLKAWNSRGDLFIFPSTYDTNGIVVRESAACGTASVLIKNSCAAEGITDGRNGYLIDETADSLAALLERLASRRDEMHRVGDCAMNEIYISWETSVRQAVDRYAEIIDNQRPGHGLLLPHRETMNELMDELHEDLSEGSQKLKKLPQNIYAGMMSNVNTVLDEAEGFGTSMHELVRDLLRR